MVETLGHLEYKQKVFTEVALGKRPLLERTAFDFDTILLGVAGIMQGNWEGGVRRCDPYGLVRLISQPNQFQHIDFSWLFYARVRKKCDIFVLFVIT